jgi:TonB-dependent SusC/RagA subfamily outer membrane receptor
LNLVNYTPKKEDITEWDGDINSISIESVESITVLKEQSSIEQYGEKGKNGVVVITTKFNQSGKADGVLREQSAITQYGERTNSGVEIIGSKFNLSGKADSPLLVVDGEEWEGDINSIAPENIESITILKEQASISVFGEKAKNGVIIIITKK